MKAYPNTDLSSITTSHPLFKAVEQQFDEWYNHNTQPGAPLAKDIKGCYYGYFDEPACFSKVGAIEQAIEEMINEADETGKPVSVNTFDFDAVFQI